ncbi:SOS response-associated peptidase [Psychroflexus aestuariivivens]|uniref:SOS response-associated peptidase n=1 Tax=Psychroflexus aestuariivivens TaxID=1795040 RepID=UPI000FDB8646|nr:SOS response-associated peptidase family protein [Psychroflexus aestuariivivens]
MCFHTSQIQTVKKLEKRYNADLSDESQRELFDIPRYHINGFSHSQLLIIPQEKPSVLAAATWGIAPEHKTVSELKAYYKEAVKFGGGLNARAEKAFSHFIYKQSILGKRCLIPVTAFFEPHEFKGKKYPFVIKRKTPTATTATTTATNLSLAGFYTRIQNVVTFTILTQDASPLFVKIHNKKKRQPVILSDQQEKQWLSNELQQSEIEAILKNHFDEDQLEYYPVSKDLFHPKVNSDVETILERKTYPNLSF